MSIKPGYTGHNSNTFIGAPPTGGPPTHSVFIPTGAANGLQRPADAPDGDYNSQRRIYTLSFWLKWTNNHTSQNNFVIASSHPTKSDGRDGLQLRPELAERRVDWQWYQDGGNNAQYRWDNACPTDMDAWHHYFLTRDTNRSPDLTRVRLTVDGVSFGDADAFFGTESTGHTGLHWAPTAYPIEIGTIDVVTQDESFYMYDLHCVDNREAAVTEFGFNDGGTWKAIEYTGNHGPSGFNLDFENAGDLGADVGTATNAGVSQPHNTIGTGVIQSTDTPPRYVP